MNNVAVLLLAAVAVVAFILWHRRNEAERRITGLLKDAQSSGATCSRAQLIDGANHIAVALRLDPRQITYQNKDFDASIDIGQIDEVEYGSDLVTGGIANGAVLRLRAHGRAFEFVLDSAAADRWSHQLPPHRVNEPGRVQSVPIPAVMPRIPA